MSDLKHFSEQDIEFAKNLAKLNLHKEKENNSNIHQSPSVCKPESRCLRIYDDVQNIESGDVNNPVVNKTQQPSNKTHQNVNTATIGKQKHKEGCMRIRQATRGASDMLRVMNNLEKLSTSKVKVPFMTPLDLEKKRRRWEDFSHLARRSLYTLKREVNLLSVKIYPPLIKLPDSSLRLLASAIRSCLCLLKGLEKFVDEIREDQRGNVILHEVLLTAQQILFIMTVGGASVTSKTSVASFRNEKISFETTEDTTTRSPDILTSDYDSKVSAVLNPKAIRKKLSKLAQSLNAKHRKGKNKKYKNISPLKDEALSGGSSYPIYQELDEGRKIEFISDSLSPKLRKYSLNQQRSWGYRHYSSAEDVNDDEDDEASESCSVEDQHESEPERTARNQYGVSEKMADAVFERILPFVNSYKENAAAAAAASSSVKHSHSSNLQVVFNFEGLKKLDVLQERFNRIEMTTRKHEQFLSEIKLRLSKEAKDTSDPLDLESAIKKANASLANYKEFNYPYPYPKYPVDCAIDKLQKDVVAGNSLGEKFRENRATFPSMQDEVQAHKMEFWKSLADKNCIFQPATEEHKEQEVVIKEYCTRPNQDSVQNINTVQAPMESQSNTSTSYNLSFENENSSSLEHVAQSPDALINSEIVEDKTSTEKSEHAVQDEEKEDGLKFHSHSASISVKANLSEGDGNINLEESINVGDSVGESIEVGAEDKSSVSEGF